MACFFANVDSDCKICSSDLGGESGTCCVIFNRCSPTVTHGFHTLCVISWAKTKINAIARVRRLGGVLEPGIFNVMCAVCRIPLEYLREMAGEPKFVMNSKKNICKEARDNTMFMNAAPATVRTLCQGVVEPIEILSAENEALGYQIARCSIRICTNRWFVKLKEGGCAAPGNEEVFCYTCKDENRTNGQGTLAPCLQWMNNIVRCDYCGDSDPTFMQRVSNCSHLRCTKCNRFEACAVCGGSYNHQLFFPNQVMKSQPYCARPIRGRLNNEGKPSKVGECLCRERLRLERETPGGDFSRKLAPNPNAVMYGVASYATNPDQEDPYLVLKNNENAAEEESLMGSFRSPVARRIASIIQSESALPSIGSRDRPLVLLSDDSDSDSEDEERNVRQRADTDSDSSDSHEE